MSPIGFVAVSLVSCTSQELDLLLNFNLVFGHIFIILYPAEEIGGIGFERGRFLVLVGNGLSFFFVEKAGDV